MGGLVCERVATNLLFKLSVGIVLIESMNNTSLRLTTQCAILVNAKGAAAGKHGCGRYNQFPTRCELLPETYLSVSIDLEIGK